MKRQLISLLLLRHISFRVFDWNFEFGRTCRNKIGHFKVSRPKKYRGWSLHWFRFVIRVDQSHLEEIDICAECFGDTPIETVSAGDESWSLCPNCRSVEGRTETVTYAELERREAELSEMHRQTKIKFDKNLKKIIERRAQ